MAILQVCAGERVCVCARASGDKGRDQCCACLRVVMKSGAAEGRRFTCMHALSLQAWRVHCTHCFASLPLYCMHAARIGATPSRGQTRASLLPHCRTVLCVRATAGPGRPPRPPRAAAGAHGLQRAAAGAGGAAGPVRCRRLVGRLVGCLCTAAGRHAAALAGWGVPVGPKADPVFVFPAAVRWERLLRRVPGEPALWRDYLARRRAAFASARLPGLQVGTACVLGRARVRRFRGAAACVMPKPFCLLPPWQVSSAVSHLLLMAMCSVICGKWINPHEPSARFLNAVVAHPPAHSRPTATPCTRSPRSAPQQPARPRPRTPPPRPASGRGCGGAARSWTPPPRGCCWS